MECEFSTGNDITTEYGIFIGADELASVNEKIGRAVLYGAVTNTRIITYILEINLHIST